MHSTAGEFHGGEFVLFMHRLISSSGMVGRLVDVTRFRRHKSTSGLKLLERKRAHLVKMTVPADSIVKTFNVVKHV